MIPELFALPVVVVLGVGIGVPAYSRLLRILRERHPEIYEKLGRPTLLMASPTRSVRLQQFLYSREALETGDGRLSSSIRFLRSFTLALILAVVGSIGLVVRAVATVLGFAALGLALLVPVARSEDGSSGGRKLTRSPQAFAARSVFVRNEREMVCAALVGGGD